MPGFELFGSSDSAVKHTASVEATVSEPTTPIIDSIVESPRAGIYYNPRLDPKNYLEGPLSLNPATRLRQMLARPGIVVSMPRFIIKIGLLNRIEGRARHLRWYQRAVRD